MKSRGDHLGGVGEVVLGEGALAFQDKSYSAPLLRDGLQHIGKNGSETAYSLRHHTQQASTDGMSIKLPCLSTSTRYVEAV